MAEKGERAKSAMGGKKSSKKSHGKHKVHRMHIRRSANGGYIAEHMGEPSEDGMMPPTEEHTLPDISALQQHVGDNMGDQPAAAAAAPAPAAAPAAPPQGM